MSALNFDFNLLTMHVGENNELTNKGFLLLLQEAAARASASVGYGPHTLPQTGLIWILLNWKLKVFSRPSWNSKITVTTWPRNFIRCYSCRDFEIYDENHNVIAIASSKWVLLSIATGRIAKITDEMSSKYSLIDKSVFENTDFYKPNEFNVLEPSFEYTIQKRDIDMNHHVNNTNYIDFAYETLPKELCNIDFKNVEIMYKHEVKLGEKILCFYSKDENNEHFVEIKSVEDGSTCAVVRLYS